jgi:hypothetical protein
VMVVPGVAVAGATPKSEPACADVAQRHSASVAVMAAILILMYKRRRTSADGCRVIRTNRRGAERQVVRRSWCSRIACRLFAKPSISVFLSSACSATPSVCPISSHDIPSVRAR